MLQKRSKTAKILLALGAITLAGTVSISVFLYYWALGFADEITALTAANLKEFAYGGVGISLVLLALGLLAKRPE